MAETSPTLEKQRKVSLDVYSVISESVSAIARDFIEYVKLRTGSDISPSLTTPSESLTPSPQVDVKVTTKEKKEKTKSLLGKILEMFSLGNITKVLMGLAIVGGIVAVMWDNFKESFTSFFSNLWENLKEGFDNLTQWFGDLFDKGGELLSNLWSGVSDFFQPIIDSISNLVTGIANWFGGKFTELKSWITGVDLKEEKPVKQKAETPKDKKGEELEKQVKKEIKERKQEQKKQEVQKAKEEAKEPTPVQKPVTKPTPAKSKLPPGVVRDADGTYYYKGKGFAFSKEVEEKYSEKENVELYMKYVDLMEQRGQLDQLPGDDAKYKQLIEKQKSEFKEEASATKPSPDKPSSKVSGMEDTKAMIKRHEGVRNEPYKDSLGLWTVGVGHLIGNGKSLPPEMNRTFSNEEVEAMFEEDFAHHKKIAEGTPGYSQANEAGKGAFIDLAFNMGKWWPKWPNTKKALEAGNFTLAAEGLKDSKWFKQVGNRGVTITNLVAQAGDGQGSSIATASNDVAVSKRSMMKSGAPTVINAPSTTNMNITNDEIVIQKKRENSGQLIGRMT